MYVPLLWIMLFAITAGVRPYIVTSPEGPIFQTGIFITYTCKAITPGSYNYSWRKYCLLSDSTEMEHIIPGDTELTQV